MTKYKFRGWDVIGNKWVYGDLVHNKKVTETGLEDRVMVGGYEVAEKSVGIFTGLEDKNGKEVYVGDIVKFRMYDFSFELKESVFEVTFKDGFFSTAPFLSISSRGKEFEVIGNTFNDNKL